MKRYWKVFAKLLRISRHPVDPTEADRRSVVASRLFREDFYLSANPDVAADGVDPLQHYMTRGWLEGRDPNPLFDTDWYLRNNPDVAGTNVNPLLHFIRSGAAEGRHPGPAFDPGWYLANNPDAAASGGDPLVHFLEHGHSEGRLATYWHRPDFPTEVTVSRLRESVFFDADWYLAQYPDVAASRIDPLAHYLSSGALEGRDPSPYFSTSYYAAINPDVVEDGANPLVHYITMGRAEGRLPHSGASRLSAVFGPTPLARLIGRYEEAGAIEATTLLGIRQDRIEAVQNVFLPHLPVNAAIDNRLAARPTLNILCPSLQMKHATGGPNTAYILGCALARQGVRVAFVSTDLPPEADLGPIKRHVSQIAKADVDALGIAFLDASDRDRPFGIGINDTFMATAWWTAHPAHAMARLTRNQRILYLIQDHESLFYGASERYTQAEDTYAFDHVPIVNTSLLRDHLVARGSGLFAEPAFAAGAFVFEPAVNAEVFRPVARDPDRPRRLLFYARPRSAERNLFGLGVAALRAAVQAGAFGEGGWEFLGMGDDFEPIALGRSAMLTPASWLDFEGYAEQMSRSDIVLSLMLSPHPSYPPLEAAACGCLAVTSEFSVKTAARLSRISPNIIGVAPRIDDLLLGLTRAVARSDAGRYEARENTLDMPTSWTESLASIVPGLTDVLRPTGCVRPHPELDMPAPVAFVRTSPELPRSPPFYGERLIMRSREYRQGSTENLISLITTVYDTPASYLFDLAHTAFGQDVDQPFEWLILDNGSTRTDTLSAIRDIRRHPSVRHERVDANLGIVGGMRWCLEHASNRYILPLDSDDLLFPDCLRTIVAFLEQTGFPPLLYTDEDKTDGSDNIAPYLKPDWDPVLFVHSCYIAHLTAIDRTRALELGCYSDPRAEGCHDWDSFMRFWAAGITPRHVPEVLYSWRLHAASTSGNHGSKPYIYDSHRFVLERFLASRDMLASHEVALAPLFPGTADYRFVPRAPQSVRNIPDIRLPRIITADELERLCRALPDDASLVRLVDPGCVDIADTVETEAETLLLAFPDIAMLGGRLHDGQVIVEAGYVFGYGGLIGCPDIGRPLTDPGYFAQAWKPRSVAAVSARLAVVRREFLLAFAEDMRTDIVSATLGLWLGFFARSRGERIVYTPYIQARVDTPAAALSVEAATALRARFGGFAHDRVGYAEHLDLTGLAPFGPNDQPPRTDTGPTYADTFRRHLARRMAVHPPVPTGAPTLSIVTTVYLRTDATLFSRTAASVLSQTCPPFEWIVLAHGPISPDLDRVLTETGRSERVTVLRLDVNLGIQGGLRHCLEQASGDFVLSLDADDLLTPDAVAVMRRAAGERPAVSIFYSDEHLLVDDEPESPVYRSAFDPLLLLSHSIVWHLIVFRRQIGLDLGVYTNRNAEYAQDWDTLLRFYEGGHEAVHVPEVLYEWRQHASSISNSGAHFEGSGTSVRAILDGIRTASGIPDLLEVRSYPADLGAPAFHLHRTHRDAPRIDLVRIASRHDDGRANPIGFPFASRLSVVPLRGPAGMERLAASLERSTADIVLLAGAAIEELDEDGLWQALKHLELVASCAAVCGVLITRGGRIVSGGCVQTGRGRLADPLAGRTIRDPGPLSLALLPHCVSAVTPDLLLIRRSWLIAAIEDAPKETGLRSMGAWLGEYARRQDRLLGCEPLLRGIVDRTAALIGDEIEGLSRAVSAHGWFDTGSEMPMRGMSGYVRRRDGSI